MPKPSAPPKNAILIGKGKWIEHIDLAGRYESAVNIDFLLRDLDSLWSVLETECVADCCGIDAFDFTPENLVNASNKLNGAELSAKIEDLRVKLEALDASVFVSQRLNNYSDRAVFEALLQHLQTHFSVVRSDA
ncbi:MAG: hypothetical protein K2W93_17545 [Burkholderiaceae bacterium]|nr:hypothetical protein [Burkholderiaceae bacterium]